MECPNEGKKFLDPYLTPHRVNPRWITVLHVTEETTEPLEKKIGGLQDLGLGKEGVRKDPERTDETGKREKRIAM